MKKGVQPSKTLWDWMDLLLVPAALGAAGYLFSYVFSRAQNRLTRVTEEQRSQDEALQAYLDQVGHLLLDNDAPLRQSDEDSEVRTLARARTLTVLSRLDGDRKAQVVQFLYEAGLILDRPHVLDLNRADLSGANLSGEDLYGANMGGADLSRADLSGAYLVGTILYRADLSRANLVDAILAGTNLSRADLSGANLRGADGMTNEELERQAATLTGATLPDGQKYEDWRKNKDSGEDGQNTPRAPT